MKASQHLYLYVAGGLLTLFGAVFHLAGFAPQIAMAVFGAAVIRDKRIAFLLPLLSMLLSDSIREVLYQNGVLSYGGFYSGQALNYALLLSTGLLGWWSGSRSVPKIFAATLGGPLMFFLLSNLFVWMNTGGIRQLFTFDGLLLCYSDALPFLRSSLIATAVFSTVFFGAYFLLRRTAAQLKLA